MSKIHIGTSGWARAFTAWVKKDLDIFCFFDNDEAGYAAQNARELSQMLQGLER